MKSFAVVSVARVGSEGSHTWSSEAVAVVGVQLEILTGSVLAGNAGTSGVYTATFVEAVCSVRSVAAADVGVDPL